MKKMTKSQALESLDNSKVFVKNKKAEMINFLKELGIENAGGDVTPFFVIYSNKYRCVDVDEYCNFDCRELNVESIIDTTIVPSFSKGDILVTAEGAVFMLEYQYNDRYVMKAFLAKNGELAIKMAYYGGVPHKANAAQIAKFKKALRDNGIKIENTELKIRKRVPLYEEYYFINVAPLCDGGYVVMKTLDERTNWDSKMFAQGNYFVTEEEANEYLASIKK